MTNLFTKLARAYNALFLLTICTILISANTSIAQVTVTATAGTMGPTAYATVNAAFAAINAGTHQGTIQIAISANTTETGPSVLNSSGAGLASYASILLFPSVDGVTISGPTTTGRGLIELNGADNVTIDGDNPNTAGINRNLTIQNTAANTITYTSCIRSATSSLISSANNNTFKNLILLGSATGRNISTATSTSASEANTFGFVALAGASTTAATTAPSALSSLTNNMASGQTANNLTLENNLINSCAKGIYIGGSSTTVINLLTIKNNIIGSPLPGDVTTVYSQGIGVSGFASGLISENFIRNIEGWAGSSTANLQTAGIFLGSSSSTGTNIVVEKNQIHRVICNNTGTQPSSGIVVSLSTSSNSTIRNNFISEITHNQSGGAAFSFSFNVSGIKLIAGNTYNIYHNTVNLFGLKPGTDATNHSSCAFGISTTSITNVDCRNNIFSNKITGGSGSNAHVAVILPSSGTSSMNLTLNNNAYYSNSLVGVSGSFHVGTSYVATPAGSATYSGIYLPENFDNSNTLPASGVNANLRAYTTILSSAGTNDNASFARVASAPFVSNTDLHLNTGISPIFLESAGALIGVNEDIDGHQRPGPAGSVNGGATAPDIGADEFDGAPLLLCSGTPVAGSTNSSLISVCPYQDVLLSLSGNTIADGIEFQWQSSPDNISYADIAGATLSQATVSQLSSTYYRAKVTCIHSGLFDYSVPVQVIMNPSFPGGIYTINKTLPTGGSNFNSFADAIAALNCGISSAVVFNVNTDIYNEQIIVPQIGTSAAKTVTFNGFGSTIRGGSTNSAERAIIKLNGADYVTFDNFNLVDTGATYAYGVQIINDADFNTITNCTINVTSNNTSTVNFAGILINSNPASITGTGASLCDNNLISGNTINGGYAGVAIVANSNTSEVNNNIVINNFIRDFHLYGIYLNGNNNTLIEGNDLSRPNRTTLGEFRGIYLTSNSKNCIISKNRIHDPFTSNLAANSACFGINLNLVNTTNAEPNIISNNVIYNFISNQTSANMNGMLINNSTYSRIYYNSITLDHTGAVSTGGTRGIYVQAPIANNGIDLRNNVISVTRGGTGAKQCIYYEGTGIVLDCNNNNFYMGSTAGTTNQFGFANGTDYNDIFLWRAGTGQDLASTAVDPLFTNSTNGDLSPTNGAMDNIGTPVAGITTDINGNTRSTITPDAGAYEFTPPAADASITWISPVNGGLAPGSQLITVQIKNLQSSVIGSLTLGYTDGVTTVSESFTGLSLVQNATQNFTFSTAYNLTGAATLNAYITAVDGVQDGNQGNDTATVNLCPGIAGVYTINQNSPASSTNFQSFADAVNAMNCGIYGDVTFNVVTGSGPYAEQVVIPEVIGANSVNTITFNGNGETVQFASVTGARHVIHLNGADHVTLTNLNIKTLDPTFGYGILLTNEANNNKVTYSVIDVSATTAITQSNSAGIVASGSATVVTTAGNSANNLLIENCQIIGGYQGVRLNGDATIFATGNIVRNNIVRDFYADGINIINQNGALIEGNDISRANRAAITSFAGVEVGAGCRNVTVNANKVHDTHNSASSQTGLAFGVGVVSADAPVGSENKVTNNLIYNMNSGSGTIYGIYNSSADGAYYYHNTVVLNNAASTGGITRGFYQITLATNIQVRNNLIYITRGGTGAKNCLYFGTTTSSIISNNNDLYINSPAGTNGVGFYSTNFTTLALWKTANSGAYDQNSKDDDPNFAGPQYNIYIPTNAAVYDFGANLLSTVPFDIVGNSRSATPDPGAYEFYGVPTCSGRPSAGTIVSSITNTCQGASAVLTATGYTQELDIVLQWKQSSTPGGPYVNVTGGSGANTGTYTTPALTSTTYYVLNVICTSSGLDSTSNEIGINVNNPPILSSTGASNCGAASLTLNATADPQYDINWYTSSNGGTPIATGSSFTTPVLNSTTTYYVAASAGGGVQSIGAPDLSIGSFASWSSTAQWMNFTVFSNTTIQSVNMFFSATIGSSFSIVIRDAGSLATVFTHNDNVTVASTSTPQIVLINATLQPGNYQINVGAAIGTYRNDAGGVYPYTIPGVISITGNTFDPTYYYMFYNWQIGTGCEGTRVPVTATISTADPISITASQTDLCNLPVGSTTITLDASSVNTGYNYTWSGNGLNATTGPSVTATPTQTTTYTVTGNDGICNALSSIQITSGTRPVLTVSATPSTICTGSSSQLLAVATSVAMSPCTTQIGTGTSSSNANGPTAGMTSATSVNSYSRHIAIYTAAEIFAAGGNAGVINQISWNKISTTEYAGGDAQFDIYIKPVGFTTHAASPINWATEIGGATLVYSSTTQSIPAATGWLAFPLTTPFTWNGVDNLEIFVDFFRPGFPSGSVTWQFTTVTNASATTTSSSLVTNVTRNSSRPNIRFTGSCSAPINYTWQPSTGLSSTTIRNPIVTLSASETFTVTATQLDNSCSVSASLPITVVPTPSAPVTSDVIRCGAGDVSLIATVAPGETAAWWNQASGGHPFYLGSQNTQTISSTTTYYVSALAQQSAANVSTTMAGNTVIGENQTAGGNMFDIVATNDLLISSFDVHLTNTAGKLPSNISVFYKVGTYVGSETNAAAWTLAGSAMGVVSAGFGNPTPLPLNLNLRISNGQTYAFYIVVTNNDVGNRLRFNSNGTNSPPVGAIATADNNIKVLTGTIIAGPFSVIFVEPRNYMWNGRVHYTVVCEGPRVPVTATVTTPPAITLTSSPAFFCDNGGPVSITATSSAAYNYTWNGGATGSVLNDNLTATTTYSVFGTDGTCNTTANITVPLGPTPSVTSIQSNLNDVCPGSPVILTATHNGVPSPIVFSEITLFRTGTGATSPYPSYLPTGDDWIEITNATTSDINLSGWSVEILGVGPRTYTFPAGVIIGGGQVLLLQVGSGTDLPANNVYFMGGSNSPLSSTSLSGFILRNNSGIIMDVVATNGFSTWGASGVITSHWNGTIPSSSGAAGVLRIVDDTNQASDWVVSTTSLLQTIGTLNPGLNTGIHIASLIWSNGGTGVSTIVNPTTTTTYTFTVTSAVGCSSTGSITINVTNTPATPIATITGSNNFCKTGSTTIDMTGSTGNIQWQSSPDGTTWTDILGANAATYSTGTLTQSTHYRVVTSCGNSSTSSPVTVVINDPQIISFMDGTRCGVGTVTLNATSNPGSTIRWYTTGGVPLGTGPSFTTPVLNTTTNYHVAAANLGSQTSVQIGNGTTSNTTTTPYKGFWKTHRQQTLYLASELSAMGITAGEIINLGYNVSALTQPTALEQFTISIKGTNSTSLTSTFQTGTTVVFGPITYTPTVGLNTHTLDIPFVWNGTDNIIVETCFNNPVDGSSSNQTGNIPSTSVTGSVVYSSATSGSACGTATGTTSSTRPNIIFDVIPLCESVRTTVTATVTPAPAITLNSTSTSVCAGESATLSVSSSNSNYTYSWSPGGATGTNITVNPQSTTYYVVNALDPNTECAAVDSIRIRTKSSPVVDALPATSTFCGSGIVNLNADILNDATVTIGTGTLLNTAATTTATSYPAPYGNYFEGAKHQMLITADELLNAGLSSGPVHNLSFNVASVGTSGVHNAYTVSIGHTALNSISTFQTGLTQVFGPVNYQPVTGWNTHSFSTPFIWDGVSNIIVETCFNNDPVPGGGCASCWTQNATTYYTATPYQSTIVHRADDGGDLCNTINTPTFVYNARPNMKFGVNLIYIWSPSIGLDNPSIKTPTATVSSTTTYTVTVTNPNSGCSATDYADITINAIPTPVITSTVANPVCEGQTAVLSTQYSAASGYQFNWNSGLSFAETIDATIVGNYDVIVTSPEGCTADTVFYSVEAATIFVDFPTTTDVLCNGDSSGTATINALGTFYDPSGNVTFGPWAYSANGGAFQGSSTLTGLWAGNHNIAVYDSASGCTANVVAIVSEPSPLVAGPVVINQNVSCNGLSDGSATVSASGGVGPYIFNWNTPIPKQGEIHNEIPAGTWTITITDFNGCTTTTSVTITEPDILTASVSSQINVGCNGGSDGSVTIVANGGTAPYAGDGIHSGLAQGTYTYAVVDANGCSTTVSVTISEPSEVTVSATSTNVSCFGLGDGTISVNASAGTTVTVNGQPLAAAYGPGVYTVVASTPNGNNNGFCTASTTVSISQPPQVTVGASSTNVTCNGFANGTITVTATGGASITINGQPYNPSAQYGPGTYTVMATAPDGNNAGVCTATTTVTITEPPVLSVTINSTNSTYWSANNGTATAVPSGGTPLYSYLWSTGSTAASINGLAPAPYTVTVTDAKGCVTSATVIITEPPFICSGSSTHTKWGPGGWGGTPNGSNPATYLYANFAAAFPNGLTIGHPLNTGCNRSMKWTTPQAITAFLPSTGTPRRLDAGHKTNFTAAQYGNTLAAQVAALTINVVFDAYDPNYSANSTVPFGSMIVCISGNNTQFNGWTVNQLLAEGNTVLACGASKGYTSALNDAIDKVNNQSNATCCPTTPVVKIINPEPVAMEDELKLNVYPNPTQGIITVSFEAKEKSATEMFIIDMQGRIVMNIILDGSSTFMKEINLGSLENGIYILNIMNSEGVISTSRVVKTQ